MNNAIMLLNRLLKRANVPFKPEAALAFAALAMNGNAKRPNARAVEPMTRECIEYITYG